MIINLKSKIEEIVRTLYIGIGDKDQTEHKAKLIFSLFRQQMEEIEPKECPHCHAACIHFDEIIDKQHAKLLEIVGGKENRRF